jgi:hypothetical protein
MNPDARRSTYADGRIEASAPERLFNTPDGSISQPFVASLDGKRFLFAQSRGNDRIGIMLNWPASRN